MSEIMTMKPRPHFIFPKDSKFGVRNLFAGIVCTRQSKESLCLGNAEKFQIWRAVLTYDQPKKVKFLCHLRLCLIIIV
jgi:hypothetical protein